jgi:hypothetical protein
VLFGLHIDTWYKLVAGAMLFCVLLLLLASTVNSIRDWLSKRKESSNGFNKNKS